MRRLFLALLFSLMANAALAQNVVVPTRPVGDNSNAAASTAFVQSALPTFSARAAGVKCDGVTDDYPLINALITVVSVAGGGTISFPPGTCLMSSSLMPVSGVSIQGAGRDVTIIKNTGTAANPFNLTLSIFGQLTGAPGNETGTATTYPIDPPTEGTGTIKTTTNANAGNFTAGQTVLISGDTHGTNFWYPDWITTVVSASAGTGIITLAENLPFGGSRVTTVQKILSLVQNVKILDLTVLGTTASALQVAIAQNVIVDNVAIRAGSGGTNGASLDFVACRNCTLQNSVGYGVIFDALGTFDTKFVNNVLNGGAIQFDGGTQNSLISGNNINDPNDGNGGGFHGVSLPSYTNRNRVISNAIANVPANFYGIASTGLAAGDGNNIIEGNTVTGANTTGSGGVALNNSVNNTVVGNWFNNLQFGVNIANNATGQMVEANTPVGVTTPYSIDSTSSIRQPFVIGPFTIAGLPACTAGFTGARAIVSNGVATPTYQGAVGTTGAVTQPVFCNGSGWIYD